MKVALILLALCACERADSSVKHQPPPTPTKPDPIQQARDEFELLPADYAVGTHKLYSRGEFMPDADPDEAFDEGDFIGRLRTLFGARDGDEYVFRHKKTGYVITAYCGDSGPAFGGGARYQGALPPADPKALFKAALEHHDDPAAEARRKADPVLAKGSPIERGSANRPLDLRELHVYLRHMEDADAGPELAGAVARLDALIAAVPPADWEKTFFYEDGAVVMHVGAKAGQSFGDELPSEQGFEFLAKQAEIQDPHAHDASGDGADANLIDFYVAHEDELADQRPRVVVAFHRFVAGAKSQPADVRSIMQEQARTWRTQLHI